MHSLAKRQRLLLATSILVLATFPAQAANPVQGQVQRGNTYNWTNCRVLHVKTNSKGETSVQVHDHNQGTCFLTAKTALHIPGHPDATPATLHKYLVPQNRVTVLGYTVTEKGKDKNYATSITKH